MKRTTALALVYLALAAAATALVGAVPPALGWWARLGLVFGLPLAVGVLATLLLPRERGHEGGSARVVGTARFHAVIAGAVLLDFGAVGVGYALGWTTFTYGEQRLEASKFLALALAVPVAIAVATLGWEWGLRARLWARVAERSRGGAAAISILCGTALALPAIAPGFEIADRHFAAAALAGAALREATSLVLFRRAGLLVAGAWRGTLFALEGFGLADWHSFLFPMANYVWSDPRLPWLRLAGTAAAFVLVVAAGRRQEAQA